MNDKYEGLTKSVISPGYYNLGCIVVGLAIICIHCHISAGQPIRGDVLLFMYCCVGKM